MNSVKRAAKKAAPKKKAAKKAAPKKAAKKAARKIVSRRPSFDSAQYFRGIFAMATRDRRETDLFVSAK